MRRCLKIANPKEKSAKNAKNGRDAHIRKTDDIIVRADADVTNVATESEKCEATKKKSARIAVIIIIVSALVFILSGGYLLYKFAYVPYKQEKEFGQYKTGEKATVSVSSETGEVKVDVPVDFDKLKKANEDIYAWINIPGTKVDYPVLQSKDDNAYYLNHTINGERSVYGSIYTEDYNNKDFNDFNTLIYGHNMKNKTMFGGLKEFRDASFFEKNRYIFVYQENRILKYEIFAACSWDNKHILANRNFNLSENRTAYLEEIFAVRDMSSQIKRDIKVTADDRIITLSTCMNNKEKRFIVSGVLIYDSQNP